MYVVSFMTLGIFWVGQQTQLNHLERSDRSLFVDSHCVSVWRLGDSFFASLLAEYTAYRVALLVYWGNIVLLGAALFFSWVCALGTGLVKADMPPEVSGAIKRRILIAQGLYAFGALLCVDQYLLEHRFDCCGAALLCDRAADSRAFAFVSD